MPPPWVLLPGFLDVPDASQPPFIPSHSTPFILPLDPQSSIHDHHPTIKPTILCILYSWCGHVSEWLKELDTQLDEVATVNFKLYTSASCTILVEWMMNNGEFSLLEHLLWKYINFKYYLLNVNSLYSKLFAESSTSSHTLCMCACAYEREKRDRAQQFILAISPGSIYYKFSYFFIMMCCQHCLTSVQHTYVSWTEMYLT